jgi:hypothetical protein
VSIGASCGFTYLALFSIKPILTVLIFSGILKIGGSTNTTTKPQGNVVIWGVFDSAEISKVLEDIKSANQDLNVTYVKKDSEYEI